MPDLNALMDELIPVVETAGAAIMEIYNTGAEAETKEDGSPVTLADKTAEVIILKALQKIVPDIPVVSEENTASHATDPPHRFFLVDPLDGTKEFLDRDGMGAFTVNIGLIEDGVPVLGVLFAPALKRMFIGSSNAGAFEIVEKTRKRLSTRAPRTGGLRALTSRLHGDRHTADWINDNNVSKAKAIGSSIKFSLIAAGEADVYPRFTPTMEWDTAAGDAILRAAGGTMVQPDGQAFVYGKPEYRNGNFIARGKA